jgi:RND family efflux transporter MFP subunit
MKFILPIVALLCFAIFAWDLILMRPSPKAIDVKRKIPSVEVVYAHQKSIRSSIEAFGTVSPHTLTTLIAEVPGIIEQKAPFPNYEKKLTSFRSGGFFQKNDLLLKIEDTDLIAIEAEAKANLRRKELQLIQELELAKQAKVEWGNRDWKIASNLVKRIPQIEKANAEKLAAEARLTQATRDLNCSLVRAPFEGRILRTMVDIGQQVGSGSPSALAEIYALNSAEVSIALSRSEMNFLGFSDGFKAKEKFKIQADILNGDGVVIHSGYIDRSEGMVDPRTMLTNLIAKVDNCFANPYAKDPIINPLEVGQFVNLRLSGVNVSIFLIPESAFRTHNTVLIIDENNRLVPRKVSVIHRTNDEVWVNSGLNDGERICVTPIEIISEGMQVMILNPNQDSKITKE